VARRDRDGGKKIAEAPEEIPILHSEQSRLREDGAANGRIPRPMPPPSFAPRSLSYRLELDLIRQSASLFCDSLYYSQTRYVAFSSPPFTTNCYDCSTLDRLIKLPPIQQCSLLRLQCCFLQFIPGYYSWKIYIVAWCTVIYSSLAILAQTTFLILWIAEGKEWPVASSWWARLFGLSRYTTAIHQFSF
jgi:hypothetical protein